MRSMTGYGSARAPYKGKQIVVELNSVNRKLSDVQIALPRELAGLETRLREVIQLQVSRGRLNVVVTVEHGAGAGPRLALDTELARGYLDAMLALQRDLGVAGEITIDTLLRSPGVMRVTEEEVSLEESWPPLLVAVEGALADLIRMREREGRNLAKDLIKRLKIIREHIRAIREAQPGISTRFRETLRERIERAGVEIGLDDDRLAKEVVFFADKSDITEETTRLESHLAQWAHHLRRQEPVGRTLEFIAQEISREFNTIGSKANDAGVSQLVVACKAEMERIREQIQNIE